MVVRDRLIKVLEAVHVLDTPGETLFSGGIKPFEYAIIQICMCMCVYI